MKNTIKLALVSIALFGAVSCEDTIASIDKFTSEFDSNVDKGIDKAKVEGALELLKKERRIIFVPDLDTLTKKQDEFDETWWFTVEGTMGKNEAGWDEGGVVLLGFRVDGLTVMNPILQRVSNAEGTKE